MAYATERAKILFGSYRRGDANDPEIYVASIARVLSSFDADLMREVTDPLTGIQTSEKHMTFMPNAGELKRYCDGVADRRDRLQRLGSKPAPDFNRPALPRPEPRPGDQATVFVPDISPRYREMVDWSKAPETDPRKWRMGVSSDNRPGIWISYDIWDQRQVAVRKRPDMPQKLELSEEAKRVMDMIDAEREGKLPVDQAAE